MRRKNESNLQVATQHACSPPSLRPPCSMQAAGQLRREELLTTPTVLPGKLNRSGASVPQRWALDSTRSRLVVPSTQSRSVSANCGSSTLAYDDSSLSRQASSTGVRLFRGSARLRVAASVTACSTSCVRAAGSSHPGLVGVR